MNERQQTSFLTRDVALFVMAENAWAQESCGAADGPLGRTAYMSNSESEIPEIVEAFTEEFSQIGLIDPRPLIGHWLIDRTGVYVDIVSFESEDEVQAAYRRIEALHDQMEGDV